MTQQHRISHAHNLNDGFNFSTIDPDSETEDHKPNISLFGKSDSDCELSPLGRSEFTDSDSDLESISPSRDTLNETNTSDPKVATHTKPRKCPFGYRLQGYWDAARISGFATHWDKVALDEEGLYSLTPEMVALQIAFTIPGEKILDAFCGLGGNAIGFARAGKQVVSVDINSDRLELARHNIRVYGVESRIKLINADIFSVLEEVEGIDCVFFDPPWGGPNYDRVGLWGFADFTPNGLDLIEKAHLCGIRRVAFRVPRNFDLNELLPFKTDFKFLRLSTDKQDFEGNPKLHYNSNIIYFEVKHSISQEICRAVESLFSAVLHDVKEEQKRIKETAVNLRDREETNHFVNLAGEEDLKIVSKNSSDTFTDEDKSATDGNQMPIRRNDCGGHKGSDSWTDNNTDTKNSSSNGDRDSDSEEEGEQPPTFSKAARRIKRIRDRHNGGYVSIVDLFRFSSLSSLLVSKGESSSSQVRKEAQVSAAVRKYSNILQVNKNGTMIRVPLQSYEITANVLRKPKNRAGKTSDDPPSQLSHEHVQ